MDSLLLIVMAVLPVVLLCSFIYYKDKHKEPTKLLIKLFFLGVLLIIPVLYCETILSDIFPTDGVENVVVLFFNVFMSVAIIEEGFKWLVTRYFGYAGKEFDEIYDVIVYSCFVSLGFACFENIEYVISYGFGTAIARAFTSIPGHTCFAIAMGVYLAKAKIASLNGNKKQYNTYMIMSIIVPALIHTLYDGLLFSGLLITFIISHIIIVIFCFISVINVSKKRVNFSHNSGGSRNVSVKKAASSNVMRCPVCGTKYMGGKYCGRCGFKVID